MPPSTSSLLRPLITIIGATGTGKSQLAVDLARAFNGEIINADAMQMYEGLDIITNKIPVAERMGIPHHLLGILGKERDKEVRIGMFQEVAGRTIEEIRGRGKVPILVGGTHYYIQALLFPNSLLEPVATPLLLEKEKEKEVERGGGRLALPSPRSSEELSRKYPILDAPTSQLLEALYEVDPIMAARWHPNDHRKIRRSLEIYYLNGGIPASELYARQHQKTAPPSSSLSTKLNPPTTGNSSPRYHNLIFWTHTDQPILNIRLRARIDKMVDQGMFIEIRELWELYKKLNEMGEEVDLQRGVWQSIGFKEFLRYLPYLEASEGAKREREAHRNETTPAMMAPELETLQKECIERMVTATTKYAKQQIKWIRIKFLNAIRTSESHNLPLSAPNPPSSPTSPNPPLHLPHNIIYLLDNTHPQNYPTSVLHQAQLITKTFLTSSIPTPLPDPLTLNPPSSTFLTPKRDYDLASRPDLWIKRYCEICDVTIVGAEGGEEWERHLESGRHKRCVRGRRKREEGKRWKERRMREDAMLSGEGGGGGGGVEDGERRDSGRAGKEEEVVVAESKDGSVVVL